MEDKKWWLINSENVEAIREALEDSGHDDALHDLDSGLHLTDCVPKGYKTEFQKKLMKLGHKLYNTSEQTITEEDE